MASPTDRMTQPPDDAALVARLKADITLWGTPNSLSAEAATALEAKDRRIADLETALEPFVRSLEGFESADMPLWIGNDTHASAYNLTADEISTARAAFEPSDKGVGR